MVCACFCCLHTALNVRSTVSSGYTLTVAWGEHYDPFCAESQLEEELQSDLRWQFLVKSILYTGRSKFQDVELLDSGPFGKARAHRQHFFCQRHRAAKGRLVRQPARRA